MRDRGVVSLFFLLFLAIGAASAEAAMRTLGPDFRYETRGWRENILPFLNARTRWPAWIDESPVLGARSRGPALPLPMG